MRPIVVHGGGAAITRAMDEAKIEPRFIQGRRYTDDATLKIVERVLADEINESIAARIEEFGGRAMPLNFAGEQNNNVLFGERLTLDGRGRRADRPGPRRPRDARRSRHDREPVLRRAGAGDSLDVRNRDGRAAERERRHGGHGRRPGAGRREAGVPERRQRRAARQERSRLADSLAHRQRGPRLIAERAIEAGMIPKVEGCLETLQKGVRKIHIIDGRMRHSLMLEIYTNQGVGTEIVAT